MRLRWAKLTINKVKLGYSILAMAKLNTSMLPKSGWNKSKMTNSAGRMCRAEPGY